MPDIEPSTLSLLITQDQVNQVQGLCSALKRLNAAHRKNPDFYTKERLAETLVFAEAVLKDIDRTATRLHETVQKWANQNENHVTSDTAGNELDSSGGERPAPGLSG